MQGHRFHLWDDTCVDAMAHFPLHKLDGIPVAYVPIRSATKERFLAVVEAGCISCVSPSIHAIHSVTRLTDTEAQEERIVSGVAVQGSEMCVVMWDAVEGKYWMHFLKAQRTRLTPIGTTGIKAPDAGLFLCGTVHLGGGLGVVWSDASLQYYTPPEYGMEGLVLKRTYRLHGFDFVKMKRRAGTEDLRKLPAGMCVCSTLNVKGLVCVVGPESGTMQLKYVVLDVESGLIQESGILETALQVDAPIKISALVSAKGEFRLFVGGEDCGIKKVKMTPATLATRIGMKTPTRKRKLEEEELDEAHPSGQQMHRDVTLTKPHWAEMLESGRSSKSSRISSKLLKRICQRPAEEQTPDSFNQRVSKLTTAIQEASDAEQKDPALVSDAVGLLKEWKESGSILLMDLSGVVLEYVGSCCQNWMCVRNVLDLSCPTTLNACPHLAGALLDACQYDLFAQLMCGLQELGSDQLSDLLEKVLTRDGTPVIIAEQANALDRLQLSLSASLSEAMKMSELPLEHYTRLKWKVDALSGFSFVEVLMHALVSVPMDRSDLQPALERLDQNQTKLMLGYLHKWLCLFKDEIFQPESIQEMECIKRIPGWKHVIDWLTALLSVKMNAILSSPSMHQVLMEMQKEMKSLKSDVKLLMNARGLCQELLRPREQEKPQSAMYQIEVFDMSFTSL